MLACFVKNENTYDDVTDIHIFQLPSLLIS